jgi:hypothetical protein
MADHPSNCGCKECDYYRKHPQIPRPYVARHPAAFINVLATKDEAIQWLQRTWDDLMDARAQIKHQRASLARLATMEALTSSRVIKRPEDDELLARIEFASRALEAPTAPPPGHCGIECDGGPCLRPKGHEGECDWFPF